MSPNKLFCVLMFVIFLTSVSFGENKTNATDVQAALSGKEDTGNMKDPIHFHPKTGMGDVLPFYWNGEYHIFYQAAPPLGVKHVCWGHIVSTDLVHWRELPYAILAGATMEEPDGHGAYSGSVIEHNGTFHAYYTGHNPHNLQGPEVTLHATSKDLIHWTKHPEDTIVPDGIHYRSIKQRPLEQQKEAWPETNPDRERFRDPRVFWNQDEQLWWMVFSARDAKTNAFVQGLATSKDLEHWQQQEPLKNLPSSDCPDVFKIGNWWYCVGHNNYYRARNPRGPYEKCGNGVLGTSMIFVPQQMFDGKRHVISGHLATLHQKKDGNQISNADVMCMLREVYAGTDGCLYMRPLKEIVDIYKTTVVDLAKKPDPDISYGSWDYQEGVLTGGPKPPAFWKARSHCSLNVPGNYMLQCTVRLDPGATLTIGFREQENQQQAPYKLHIRPRSQEVEIEAPGMVFPRKCSLDASKPIDVQAFVQGSIIECFVDNAHAFTIRGYDYPQGKLSFDVTNGSVKILDLKVKVTD